MSEGILCEHCSSRPAAFQVKHPETSLHWRCLGCVRDMALNDSKPFIIFGTTTKNRTRHLEDGRIAARMANAMQAAAAGPPPSAPAMRRGEQP